MTTLQGLTPAHRLLACLVALIWGVNFLAIHVSLEQFPPLFLVALRFTLLAIPTVLLVPRPEVPTRWLLGYGFGFGILQFTFLYTGMAAGMPAGLASLVLQASGPFTLVLGALLLNERVSGRQWLGVTVAAVGMVVVGVSRAGAAQLLPYLLVLLAALGWALGNLSSRLAAPPNPLHMTMWMSVVVPVPMFAMSLLVEGPHAIMGSLVTSVRAEAIPAWTGLAYTVIVGTVVGSGIWTWLLARYPAGVVGPFSMLVPVVGMATAALVLHETPSPAEIVGGIIVVLGVLLGSGHGKHQRSVLENNDTIRDGQGRPGEPPGSVPTSAPRVGAGATQTSGGAGHRTDRGWTKTDLGRLRHAHLLHRRERQGR